jgi:hypothetical protein
VLAIMTMAVSFRLMGMSCNATTDFLFHEECCAKPVRGHTLTATITVKTQQSELSEALFVPFCGL